MQQVFQVCVCTHVTTSVCVCTHVTLATSPKVFTWFRSSSNHSAVTRFPLAFSVFQPAILVGLIPYKQFTLRVLLAQNAACFRIFSIFYGITTVDVVVLIVHRVLQWTLWSWKKQLIFTPNYCNSTCVISTCITIILLELHLFTKSKSALLCHCTLNPSIIYIFSNIVTYCEYETLW